VVLFESLPDASELTITQATS